MNDKKTYCVKLSKRDLPAEELIRAKQQVIDDLRDSHNHLTFADLVQLDVPIGLITANVAAEPGSKPKTWLTPPIIRLLESKPEWYPQSWLSRSIQNNRRSERRRKQTVPYGLEQIPEVPRFKVPVGRRAKMVYGKLLSFYDPGDVIPVQVIAWVGRVERSYAKTLAKEMVTRGYLSFRNNRYILL